MNRLTVLSTGETFDLLKVNHYVYQNEIKIWVDNQQFIYPKEDCVIDEIPLDLKNVNFEQLLPGFKERIQKLVEIEMYAIEIRDFIREQYPTALEIVYTIDSDMMNERIYYDFKSLKDREGNILVGDDSDDFDYISDMINNFIWRYISYDDTLFNDKFTINLDTFEVAII